MSTQQQVRYRGFPATDRDRLPRFIDRFDGALQRRLDGEDRIALAVLHETNHCPHDRKGGHFECFPDDLKVREFQGARGWRECSEHNGTEQARHFASEEPQGRPKS